MKRLHHQTTYQGSDEVLSTTSKVDDAAEDVGVALILKLFQNGISSDVHASATAAVAVTRQGAPANNGDVYRGSKLRPECCGCCSSFRDPQLSEFCKCSCFTRNGVDAPIALSREESHPTFHPPYHPLPLIVPNPTSFLSLSLSFKAIPFFLCITLTCHSLTVWGAL